jgi:hypothetical protein
MARQSPTVLVTVIAVVASAVVGCGSSGGDAPVAVGDEDGWVSLEGGVLGPPLAGEHPPSPTGSTTYPALPPQPTIGDVGVDTSTAADSRPPPATAVVDAPVDAGLVCTDTTVDVDGVIGNLCEVADPMVNRSESSSTKLAVLGACTPYATVTFDLVSDARTHTPSGSVGAAPLYWSFFEDTTCALGTKPTLGQFSVAAGAPGSYEVVIYPSGGAPDPKCTAIVRGGESAGPITCANPVSSGRVYLRIRKLDGGPGTARVTFKVR